MFLFANFPGQAAQPEMAGEYPLRVLVVDDYQPFWALASEILGKSKRFHVVAEAADGVEGVRLASELHPDLILMDVELPRMNGLKATERILQLCPQTKVVLLSMYHEKEYSRLAAEIGALAYIPKRNFNLETLARLLAEE